ncbi:hypothetical protein [Acidisoma sp. 7E03]
MAQFGGDPVNFPQGKDANANPRRPDPETPPGGAAGVGDPPNTGGRSQTEAVRIARRGGSVAPPITQEAEKQGWIPKPPKAGPRAGDR